MDLQKWLLIYFTHKLADKKSQVLNRRYRSFSKQHRKFYELNHSNFKVSSLCGMMAKLDQGLRLQIL